MNSRRSPRRARRLVGLVFALALSLATGAGAPARAQNDGNREYDLKAAFLYNFVKFIDWPARALPENSSTVVVGILGRNPFGASLSTIQGKTVKGRTLVVRPLASVRDAQNCQVVFVSASEKERVRQILDALQSENVLTVGETPGFAEGGGVINFTEQKNRIRFEINPEAASRARLTISSQLLKLASIVRG